MRYSRLNEPSEPRVAGSGPFKTERVTESQFLGPLQLEWQALHDRLSPRTPFTAPVWNALWWKHFRSQQWLVGNELFAHTVRDADSRLVGVAPMMSTDRPSVGPLRVRTLRCFGADPNITELRGLICEPRHQPEVFRSLREHVARHYRFDWIDWGAIHQDNWQPVTAQLSRRELVGDDDVTDFHLAMPATWDEFRASRSRNIKESIRKCHNSLKREGHSARLRVVDQPAECAAAIQSFLALHAQRSKATHTIQHRDVFDSPRAQSFLHELAELSARRNELRMLQLLVDETVVAARIGFLFGDELYLYYSGYDTAWGRHSVMTRLVVETLKWSIEQRIKLVNLSTGSDVSKLRWGPSATRYRGLIQAMPGIGQRLALATYRYLRRSRARRLAAASPTQGMA